MAKMYLSWNRIPAVSVVCLLRVVVQGIAESWRQSITLSRPRIDYIWTQIGDNLDITAIHLLPQAGNVLVVDLNYGIQ